MIIIVDSIYEKLDRYTNHLINEGLTSNARAHEKRNEIIKAIYDNLGGIVSHRPSIYRDLGRDEGCRLYVFASPKTPKTQWGIAHKVDADNNVIVYYMRNLKLVKEK